jgi:hypothetical protein
MPSGVYDHNHKQTDEERKANAKDSMKKYNQSEKGKANRKKGLKKFRASEKFKASRKKYQSSEKFKASRKKYQSSEKFKANLKKYYSSEKGKAKQKEYLSSEKGKASLKKFQASEKGHSAKRLKVLLHYSKRLSNSDIPCCRCCGQNSHHEFLDVDHIQGRYEMDSIPELVELEYSSRKSGGALFTWLIRNNYLKNLQTEYFQILCKNCNGAKGIDGKCPMENKPH